MSIADKLSEVKISRLPLRQPAMVERGASILETVEAMKTRRLGCALVCEQGKLVGLFTERDLLNKVIGEPVSYSTSVEQVMTVNPARLSLDDSVYAAMRLMREGDYRNVPLVDGQGVAAGVLTVRDLVSYLAEHFPKEALNLPPDHDQLMRHAEGA
ncbi:MAG TPA: CBS domain-containing protein [Blastocatellia bacterium]|nr:CBS domain-containing protein [Blastocatellia bacterium]